MIVSWPITRRLLINNTPVSVRVSLQRLKHTESDRLQVQIQAYLDNVFDVGTLLEDAETKTAALERVEELEESLGTVRWTGAGLTCLFLFSELGCVLDAPNEAMKDRQRETCRTDLPLFVSSDVRASPRRGE